MTRLWLPGLSNEHKFTALAILAAFFLLMSGFAINYERRAHTFTRTLVHNRSIAEQYGRPSQSVNGAQVNSALAGMTCDVYAASKTVICHP